MDKYIKPSVEDIQYLKQAQECDVQLSKKSKDEGHANIFFYIGLILFILGFLGQSDLFTTMGGFGLFGLLLGGFFKYSYAKGEGKYRKKYLMERREEHLNKVECKWDIKGDKYYVYLKEGQRIEVDEY
jgi:hypothetical protein